MSRGDLLINGDLIMNINPAIPQPRKLEEIIERDGWLYHRGTMQTGVPKHVIMDACHRQDMFERKSGPCHSSSFFWDITVVRGLLLEGQANQAVMHLLAVTNRVSIRSYEVGVLNQLSETPPKMGKLQPFNKKVEQRVKAYEMWVGPGVDTEMFWNLCVIFQHLELREFYEALLLANSVLTEIGHIYLTAESPE